jgi:hydrogenase maturation protein HypF
LAKTYKIVVKGQVQGVGFRPYVYTLAHQLKLKGSVSNNEAGVIIYISGQASNVGDFYRKLTEQPPNVSRIIGHSIQEVDYKQFNDFQIIPSHKSNQLNLQLTPDFSVCDQCKQEISDHKNRRYRYPFTTCVNCGPRWAITDTFSFERHHTSMDAFDMCEACEHEYHDPMNRRFHSQTNSCATCGIALTLTNADGQVIDTSPTSILSKLSSLIKAGHIIAIKNTGGYLLCCDANNEMAINRLRARKNRPTKPFAIMYPSMSLLEQHLDVGEDQKQALLTTEGPIVILPKINFKGALALEALAPNLNQLGVMLPYSALLELLARELMLPVVATSGNMHGAPIISSRSQATVKLKDVADYFLHHNLNIVHAQDDSVVKYSAKFGHQVLFRRSRGYAPNYFHEGLMGHEKIMAMGSHLKSTIAFLPNDYLYISSYLGNLDNFDVYTRFSQNVTNFVHLFEQKPEVILIDNHPTYQSTLYGTELSIKWKTKLHRIQHHKAHFAAVLGEHHLFEAIDPILGVIWDGTGYGEDGHIWGGEFFTYQGNKMNRTSHFEYFDWLAGDKMAQHPRLSLFSLADHEMYPEIANKFSDEEISIYNVLKKRNTLKTSSVGRLFDAISSLLNICDQNTYEGEAAIRLENQVMPYDLANCRSYADLLENGIISTSSLIKNVYRDVKHGVPREAIILNFLFTLATLVFKMANRHHINKIAFSGGVFQNTTLIDILKELGKNEYSLYFNRNLSPNDENISFGQFMYYLNIKDE